VEKGIKFIKINIFFLVKIWELKKSSYLCTPIKTEEKRKGAGDGDELTRSGIKFINLLEIETKHKVGRSFDVRNYYGEFDPGSG